MTIDNLQMSRLIEKWVGDIENCGTLTEQKVWNYYGPTIWKAKRFVGRLYFIRYKIWELLFIFPNIADTV